MKDHTRAVHAGQLRDESSEFPVPQIVLNSAVLLKDVSDGRDMLTHEVRPNLAYQRYSNHTVLVLERKVAAMEGAKHALAVNSGMTACLLVFRALLNSGDHIVLQYGMYHEITDQVADDVRACGISFTIPEEYSPDGFIRAMNDRTKMVFIETPTNPAMLDVDIPALADVCNRKGIALIVDNTFLTFFYQKPLALGASVALYSTTKHLNGHGDAMGGVLTTNDSKIYETLKRYRDNSGLIIDPFSAYLHVRGLRTLALRLSRQSDNAQKLAEFLESRYPRYRVISPLKTKFYSQNRISGPGGIISLVLDTKEQGEKFLNALRLFKIGTTFGNLESLCYCFGVFARPHRDITKIGIPQGLVRLSCGIEDIEDITQDVDQALKTLSG